MAQFTKQAIEQTFMRLLNERPLDKITVTDIVDTCGINRNTFYYYFTDIYALIDELFRAETQNILDNHRQFDTWQEGFLEATSFALGNRRAICHLYHSINRDRLEEYLYEVTKFNMTDFIEKHTADLAPAPEDVAAIAAFYTAALVGLVMKWLHDGMKEEPEPFIARIGNLLEGNIRAALERKAKSK